MRTHLLCALAAASVGALLGAPRAGATPSGLAIIPSTDIYDPRVAHLNITYNRIGSPLNQSQGNAGLSLGVGDGSSRAFRRTELGFDAGVLRVRDTSGVRQPEGDTLVLNIKTQLFDSEASHARLVAGAYNLGNSNSPRVAYVVGSKNFGSPGRVHLGVQRALNKSALGGSAQTQVLLGYEKVLGARWTLLADYVGGSSSLGAAGASAVYTINERSGIQIAVIRPNSSGVRASNGRATFFVGYDLNFGRGARAAADAPDAAPETGGAAKK